MNEETNTTISPEAATTPAAPDLELGLLEFQRADPEGGDDGDDDSPASRVLARPRQSAWARSLL